MFNVLIDITGQRYGRLTVLRRGSHPTRKHAHWLCVCDCGKEVIVVGSSLRRGLTRSCGCLWLEAIKKSNSTHGESAHSGRRGSKEYLAWQSMKQRCTTDKNHPSYPFYGARGIYVCERWLTYENFLADMGRAPNRKHSLDRIDNDGIYEPGNCCWGTVTIQMLNKRKSKRSIAEAKRHVGRANGLLAFGV